MKQLIFTISALLVAGVLVGCGGNFYGGGDVGRRSELSDAGGGAPNGLKPIAARTPASVSDTSR